MRQAASDAGGCPQISRGGSPPLTGGGSPQGGSPGLTAGGPVPPWARVPSASGAQGLADGM
eukprot:scaffold257507_cov10-Tisochrysis_lutea.AAC.1